MFASNGVSPARAAAFTVDSTIDAVDAVPGDDICDDGAGNCTLRAAIMETNALPGPDAITLPAGTYKIAIRPTGDDTSLDGDFDITEALAINGAGAELTILNGEEESCGERVLHITDSGNAEISGVTIQKGSSDEMCSPGAPTFHPGGGIWSEGTLILRNSMIKNNHAGGSGGGIHNSGVATIIDSTVTSNWAYGGSGISNGGTLRVIDSLVSGNSNGGGISNSGDLTITGSVINANRMIEFCWGGGIVNRGSVTITNSILSDNRGTWAGGAIFNYDDGSMSLTNVTISGSVIEANPNLYCPLLGEEGVTAGGAILNLEASATLTNVTIAGNDSPAIFNSSGDLNVRNVMIGDNEDTNCEGTITSLGHNLGSDGTCGLTGPGDVSGVDPKLGPLADNGGPTLTHALLSGSPAIDAGDDTACPETDQRGATRPTDGDSDGIAACDIGAYEAPEGTTLPAGTEPTAISGPSGLPAVGGAPSAGSAVPRAVILASSVAAGIVLAAAGGRLVARRRP